MIVTEKRFHRNREFTIVFLFRIGLAALTLTVILGNSVPALLLSPVVCLLDLLKVFVYYRYFSTMNTTQLTITLDRTRTNSPWSGTSLLERFPLIDETLVRDNPGVPLYGLRDCLVNLTQREGMNERSTLVLKDLRYDYKEFNTDQVLDIESVSSYYDKRIENGISSTDLLFGNPHFIAYLRYKLFFNNFRRLTLVGRYKRVLGYRIKKEPVMFIFKNALLFGLALSPADSFWYYLYRAIFWSQKDELDYLQLNNDENKLSLS